MKKAIVIMILALFCLSGSLVFGDEIKLVEPQKGAKYFKGITMTIKWEYNFAVCTPMNESEKLIKIWITSLPPLPKIEKTIGTADVFWKNFYWKIDVDPGQYHLIIEYHKGPHKTKCHLADLTFFEVVSPLSEGVKPSPVNKTITILSPEAGKTYYFGDTLPIRWKTDNIKEFYYVYIDYFYPDGKTPAPSSPAGIPIPNTGSADASLAGETQEGSWRVRISTKNKEYVGMSEVFHIKRKPLTDIPKVPIKKK